jgi:hypothetical protein
VTTDLLWFANGSPASNKNPNSMPVKNPYTDPFSGRNAISPDWTSQKTPALFLASPERYIPVHFIADGGPAVGFTVRLWVYNRKANVWINPQDDGVLQFNSGAATIIQNLTDPVYAEIVSVTDGGTVSAYYDGMYANAL